MKRILAYVYVAMACIVGLSFSSGARANIDYTFSGVTFDDGGTLTGTFTTNNAITSLLDFDITTTAGSTNSGFHYTTGTVGSGPTALPSIIVLEPASQRRDPSDYVHRRPDRDGRTDHDRPR